MLESTPFNSEYESDDTSRHLYEPRRAKDFGPKFKLHSLLLLLSLVGNIIMSLTLVVVLIYGRQSDQQQTNSTEITTSPLGSRAPRLIQVSLKTETTDKVASSSSAY
jgi:hypothetical protein